MTKLKPNKSTAYAQMFISKKAYASRTRSNMFNTVGKKTARKSKKS